MQGNEGKKRESVWLISIRCIYTYFGYTANGPKREPPRRCASLQPRSAEA